MSFIKKRYLVIVYVGLWLILTFLASFEETSYGQLIASLDVGSAVALAVFATLIYYQSRKDEDWIDVVFVDMADEELGRIEKAVQREDCTRGEVNGVLRAYQAPKSSFSIKCLNHEDYRAQLRGVKDGHYDELRIRLQEGDHFGELMVSTPTALVKELSEGEAVFMNVSNHPLEAWSADQEEAAYELFPEAQLIDVAFPKVNPTLSTVEVEALTLQFWADLRRRLQANDQRPVAAMVAGEPILCLGLVRALQGAHIQCYSATTQRDTVIDPNDVKISRFRFVRFRIWPTL